MESQRVGTKVQRKMSKSPPRQRRFPQQSHPEHETNGNSVRKASARRKPGATSLITDLFQRKNEDNAQQNNAVGGGGDPLSRNVLMGLTVAGVAQALLTTIFRLFHVNVFLQSYQLPLESYSNGSFVVSIITTLSSVVGSWMVDTTATKRDRTESVGQIGFYFVACFLTPFFGYHPQWGTLHFIVTVSLYQTLYSYMAILLGSIVTDSHLMTHHKRVAFMASGKAANLVTSFAVARIALMIFEENHLHAFRVFLTILAAITLFLFALAQSMIQGSFLWRHMKSLGQFTIVRKILGILIRKDNCDAKKSENEEVTVDASSSSMQSSDRPKKPLRWQRIVGDFVLHHNFCVWVVMEMLLHAQITFNANFLKTFVDHLLVDEFGRDTCDWLLSLVGPVSQLVTIVAYIPIHQWGYPRIYLVLFISNFVLSNILLWFVGPNSGYGILAFLTVYCVSTRAVQSAGFHLAMADLVLEMKRNHAKVGRYNEPSVAGLFMGANALICKPMESILPMIAADVMEYNGSSRQSLFCLLVLPPMACAVIQVIAWTSFDLTPRRVAIMRRELQEHFSGNNNNSFIDILDP